MVEQKSGFIDISSQDFPEQVLQAEQMAAEWLKKTNRLSPVPVRDAEDRTTSAVLRAASE